MNAESIAAHHLLLALLAMEDMIAVTVLKKFNVNIARLRMEIEKSCGSPGGAPADGALEGLPLPFSVEMKRVLIKAHEEAVAMHSAAIDTVHLLIGILANESSDACRILKNMGFNPENSRDEVMRTLESVNPPPSEKSNPGSAMERFFEHSDIPYYDEDDLENPDDNSSLSGDLPALNTYGRNMTELAAAGKLDPVIGRADEIERVIQILCRRTKNNPVLIGEAGVGKTAIIEGLAQAVAAKKVPEILCDKQIYSIDLPLMVAGTKYRGQSLPVIS